MSGGFRRHEIHADAGNHAGNVNYAKADLDLAGWMADDMEDYLYRFRDLYQDVKILYPNVKVP